MKTPWIINIPILRYKIISKINSRYIDRHNVKNMPQLQQQQWFYAITAGDFNTNQTSAPMHCVL